LQQCHQRLNVLHNYFDNPIKLFSDLYLAKFLEVFKQYRSFRVFIHYTNSFRQEDSVARQLKMFQLSVRCQNTQDKYLGTGGCVCHYTVVTSLRLVNVWSQEKRKSAEESIISVLVKSS